MSSTFLRRPQSNTLRKALFQVHLWTGVALALYVCVVGFTGAALVFRQEMQKATFPEFFHAPRGGQPDAEYPVVLAELRSRYPSARFVGLDYPTYRRDTYLSYLTHGNRLLTVFSHPTSAHVIGEMPERSWITWVQDLHFDLLAGRTGRVVNGIGALSLVLAFATGLIVWWPGIDRWRQSLTFDLRKPWKRVTWDLHSAAGFWLFALLMIWAVTGVQFAFRAQFRRAVNAVSPLTVFIPPTSRARPEGTPPIADTSSLIAKARELVPGARMGRIVQPSSEKAAVLILMARETHGDFDTSDEVLLYFDQYTGELLLRREPALEGRTAGDMVMAWLGPIHLGSFGGIGTKILWSLLALSFPLLAATGTLMWWNRVVRRPSHHSVSGARDL